MFKRSFAMAVIVASLAAAPATRAVAQADTAPAPVSDGSNDPAPAATRDQNRDIQIALNYFGFPAGAPDGILGPNSRAAISRFQIFMGYPDTGQLTRSEREFLLSSHQRAIEAGTDAAQAAADGAAGVRSALKAHKQEAAAPAQAAAPEPPEPAVLAAPDPQATAAVVAAPPEPDQLPGPAGKSAPRSLAALCNKGAPVTSAEDAETFDADSVLSTQFCLARADAISQGESLANQLQDVSAVQIVAQCDAFGAGLKEQIAGLSLQPESEVMKAVGGFVPQTGLSPVDLSGMARICLSVGYRTDNMDVALASALLLTVVGAPAYAELVGHHLSQGFGVPRRPDLALAWYETGLDAIDKGAQPVFMAGQPGRSGLIRKAAHQAGGRSDGAARPTP